MESSQYSYGAPGPSYEGPEDAAGPASDEAEAVGGTEAVGESEAGERGPAPAESGPAPAAAAEPPPGGAPEEGQPAPRTVPAALPVPGPGHGLSPPPPPPAQPPGYPVYPGGFGPPGYPPAYHYPYQMAPPRMVRHTLRRRTWLWLVVVTALVAALVGGLVGAVVGAGSQQTVVTVFAPNRSVLAHPQDVQEVLAKVEPAVVSIDSESGAGGSTGGDFVQAAGSGMIITADGEVLTNNHVIAGASSVTVTLFGQSKAQPAHVLGTDPTDDLALIQIDRVSGLPTVSFGDSAQTRVGDSVLAIGNALALAGGPTVTEGIVSAENRSLSAENETGQTENLTGLLQTDAAINPGNSGGPLVNAQAQVVGMNTAVASSSAGNAPTENIGFAITVDSVKPRLARLRQGGAGGTGSTAPSVVPSANTAYIGVTVGTVTPALQQQDNLTPSSGALVLAVQQGSPADNAGLQVNDVIVSLDSTPIQSPADLTAAIHPHKAGDRVTLGIYRGSNQTSVPVTLAPRPTGG